MAIPCGVMKRGLLLVVGAAEYIDLRPAVDQKLGHGCMTSIACFVESRVTFIYRRIFCTVGTAWYVSGWDVKPLHK